MADVADRSDPARTGYFMNAGSPPASLRQGYDRVSGAGRSTAILGDAEEVGDTSSFQCTVCTSIEELSQALEIDQSLSISYGPIGSLNQKLTFIKNLHVTTTSISIVVYVRHVARKQSLGKFQLDPSVTQPKDPADVAAFFHSYGDSFLSSRTLGGEYYAVYTFYANDVQEQNSVKASLDANGIFSGVSLDAKLQASFDQVIKTSTMRTDFAQNVSGIENPRLPAPEDIVKFATNFTSLPMDMQAVIDFDTTGYEHVPGLEAIETLAANRTYFVGDQTDDGLARKLADLMLLQNKISHVIDIYRTYGYDGDLNFTTKKDQVQKDIEAIGNQIRQWEHDPTQTFNLPPLPSLTYGSPSVRVLTNIFGPHGGGGGAPFDDIPDPVTFVMTQTHLTSIRLTVGAYVNVLSATYQRTHGTAWTSYHGGGGAEIGSLPVSASAPVRTVSGRSGRYVNQLTFMAGSTLDGNGSDGGGSAFSHNIPAGNFLLGFRGRSGEWLNQVIIVYAGFQPAIWQ
jgi:hypothetical protein